MARGRLRVMLGAAPGVGKTFAMLEEGRRLRDSGRDVVVAVVETHGRAATADLLEGLEVLPRRSVEHRGVVLDDFDLEALLRRRPEIALVDELAHTNAPGSRHAKRWQDIAEILDAGIDVISTVNIQHIESLGDVVREITGVVQRETIPDSVLRSADQIELVDVAPQALRDRLGEGLVYPAARVDAALSNYFRLGNLTALRELALLWLADEVDSALQKYRAEKGIENPWRARERVVVALTGGREGETLLRRGARIASRASGGELFAVHVTSPDGLERSSPDVLAAQRALVESLGGSFHQVVGEQIPRALVEFARGVDATQLVIGVSRRSALSRLLGGPGTAATVIREAGDIDVHIVSHSEAGTRTLPSVGGALSRRRRILGFVVVALGLPALTAVLHRFLRDEDSVAADLLLFQLFVVIVALIGGIWPALLAAIAGSLLVNFFFVEPRHTVTIADPQNLLALTTFVVVAVLVSIVVDRSARRSRAATRAAAESETLSGIAGSVIGGQDALEALVSRLRESFGMTSVILRAGGSPLYTATDARLAGDDDVETTFPIGEHATLDLRGPDLAASDRRILGAFLSQIDSALRQRALQTEAERMRPVAEADRLRTALLASVGHDLRRPLAAATAAVSALRSTEVILSESDERELLAAADESLAALADLVTKLLDASRLQAGVLAVELESVPLDDVVGGALDELGLVPGDVELDLPPGVPPVRADRVLLQRAVVNVLSNAMRFSESAPPRLASSVFEGRAQLRVIDSGPGIPAEKREDVFVAFQRLGDTDSSPGIGLGLALSKGFVEAMGGTIEAEDTPGGGLTVVFDLPVAGGEP